MMIWGKKTTKKTILFGVKLPYQLIDQYSSAVNKNTQHNNFMSYIYIYIYVCVYAIYT